MGFDIQIKHSKGLVIPKESGYVPPHPDMKGYIRFSGEQMSRINNFMAAVGVLDKSVQMPSMRDQCAKGKIPGYKFFFNDGEHISRDEAAQIAAALTRQDIFSEEFLESALKKPRGQLSEELEQSVRELMGLWIAFNKVAAVNDGYTVH